MNSQVLPQQDFFMYIPDWQEKKGYPLAIRRDCNAATVQGNCMHPSAFNDWVKIALDGPVTVYAHVWDMEDEEIAV